MLNTHNLDMILQLKYMPIVMNPARIASSDWKSWKCYGCDTPYLQNEFGDLRFFYVFNLILSFSTCSQSFKKICGWELLGANVHNFLEGKQSQLVNCQHRINFSFHFLAHFPKKLRSVLGMGNGNPAHGSPGNQNTD